MSAFANWLISTFFLVGAATLLARLIPDSAASKRYVFWWGVLVAVLLLPWMPPSAGTLPVVVATDDRGLVHSSLASSWWRMPTLPLGWLRAIAGMWAVAAVVRLFWLVRGLAGVARLAAESRPLPEPLLARFTVFTVARRASRDVVVCESDRLRGACALGYRRPRILVSTALLSRLEPRMVEAVLLHEYAHLQRYDDWACLVQAAVRAVCGLHPAVWWTCRQLDVEREAACDTAVVVRTTAPVAYARALGLAAEIVATTTGLMPRAVPGASMLGAGLEARVVRVLHGTTAQARHVWTASILAVLLLASVVGVVQRLPPLVRVVGAQVVALHARVEPRDAPAPMAWRGARRLEGPVSDVATPAMATVAPGRSARRRLRETVRPNGETTAQSEPLPSAVPMPPRSIGREPLPEDIAPVLDVAAPAPALAPLVSRPLPLDSEPLGPGTYAMRAGSLTADAASRAALALGGFFRARGRAVAQRF